MEILNNGIWIGNDVAKHHQFDFNLAQNISLTFTQNNIFNVIDVGCGLGLYVKNMIDNNINCVGIDGNPYTKELTFELCNVQDISMPIYNQQRYDGVLCLEVGEHIPKEYEEQFITNLVNYYAKLLILSWAIPNQGGDGHVNEQDNGYIISKLNNKGYIFDYNTTLSLRLSVTNCWWFRNSLLVFNK